MNARSALFDLYGDHLRARGGRAPVSALVRMLAALDVAPPAVRTAVSRMVRQGWLEPVKLPEGAGYALTRRASRRLDDAAARVYRTRQADWDGHWHLLVTTRLRERTARERLRSGLGFLGFAPLDDTTWIGPRTSPEVDALLEGERVRAERFTALHDGDSAGLVARAWDLEGLARAYTRWIGDAEVLVAEVGSDAGDEQAFSVRSRLVHEWRKFLFTDPGLPAVLLPADWPGVKAADLFDAESARLFPAASRFVDRAMTPDHDNAPHHTRAPEEDTGA
ncbi:MAG: PaaX family transcriptional regulator [Actinomycetes bacterium]